MTTLSQHAREVFGHRSKPGGIRIEICGAIASGKTTLAAKVAPILGAATVFENFRENPFWHRFYLNPDAFRPEKDVCFLAQHTGEIKAAGNGVIVCDYATVQDLAYAQLASDPAHTAMMLAVYRQLYENLVPATLIVHLRCEPVELMRRIRARGRPEEQMIPEAYLVALERNLADLLDRQAVPVLTVHSDEADFLNGNEDANHLLTAIASRALLRSD